MGNTGSKDILHDAANKTLDISHHLTPDQYTRHVGGECLEQCLLELPWEVYYNTVTFYETVDASFNFIGSIPSEFSLHVPHLRHLNLSHNQLPSLPPSFQLLLHLHSLHLSYNRLKQFPSCLVRLPRLHTLDLSHNSIRDLPQHCWAHMVQLEKLNLSHNELHLLPNALASCTNLRVLVVYGNQLMHPPQQVCSEGSAAILAYLLQQYLAKDKPKATPASPCSPVFRRVRGDHVSASVSNPESALRQYQQGSYTGPGSKRKCPMMPPKGAPALPPHSLTQALMGLLYGAVTSEAVGLSSEGLSRSEVKFHYSPDTLGPGTRIRDRLRSHYPSGDWGPQADLMVTTLESVLRWGGVVDELEWAAQVHQWTVHGIPHVDERPGAPLSPLLKQVISSANYAVSPHASAAALYSQLIAAPSAGGLSDGRVTDAFVVADDKKASASETPPLHANDNSCLSAALVMGLPSFSQSAEVRSNAERISRSSHAAPVARAAAVLVAGVVAAVLQGRFECIKREPGLMEGLLDELFTEVMESVTDGLEKTALGKVWRGEAPLKKTDLPSSHVGYTLVYLKRALIQYSKCIWERDEGSSTSPLTSTSETEEPNNNASPVTRGRHQQTTDSRSGSGETGGTADFVRSESVTNAEVSDALVGSGVTVGDARLVYKRVIGEVCLEGGWGVCAHACVVGGVLGALGGYNRLPIDWLKQLAPSNQKYLNNKVNLLLDMFGLP